MNEKVLELAQGLKVDSEGVIKDFNNGYVDLEFAKGCVISNDLTLDNIEELWDLDLSKYRISLNFAKLKP